MPRSPTWKSFAAPPPSASASTSCSASRIIEGELVDWIQEAHAKKAAGLVINPAGYTTTSIAILDALLAVKLPVDRNPHHQYPRARKLPAEFLRVEGGQGGDLRLRHRRLCAGDHRAWPACSAPRQNAESGTVDGKIAENAPLVDHELIHELTKLLDETGLTEIEIEQDGQRVRVARGAAAPAPAALRAACAPAPHPLAEIGRGAARSRQASRRRDLAHGRHRLSRARARRQAVRRGRQQGESRRHAADHRSDEDHEPDSGAARRHA